MLFRSMIFFWASAVIVILGAELNRGLIELRKVQNDDEPTQPRAAVA